MASMIGSGSAGSVSLGRWLGIPVRLHISFVLLGIFLLFALTRPQAAPLAAYAGLCIVIWLGCAILHEAGHCIAVVRLGGHTDQVVLTPLGGLSHYTYLQEPQRELIAAWAGPLASFCGWFAGACWLFAWNDESLVGLLNPLAPQSYLFATDPPLWLVALRFSVYLNWTLVVANLLPAIPLDCGWALRCLLWPQLGHQRALLVVRRVSLVVAVALCGAAVWAGVWTSAGEAAFLIPPWVPLAVLGVCIASFVFAPAEAYPEEGGDEQLFGYDFSQGYTSLEPREDPPAPRPKGPLRRWIARKRSAREAQRLRIEQEEEQQVDSILARLHERGIESLSPEERALLYRVSARYRSRSSQ